MFIRSLQLMAFSLIILSVCRQLIAQERGYHTELSDGTSGWIILVNDSQKPIETFSLTGKCGTISTEFVHDSLDGSRTGSLHPAAGKQSDTIKPGERFFSITKLLPQSSGCTWKVEVNAAIYTDGTYDGDENVVRALQARRDGILAAAQDWTERLEVEFARKTAAEIVIADAKRLAEEDLKKMMAPSCSSKPLACGYWQGRRHVDANVALHLERSNKDLDAVYAWNIQDIERWRKKIDTDGAFKRMDAIFPIMAELAAETIASSTHR